ncbi:MAG: cytochrome c [Myxococcaceae bacterium]
MNSNRTLLLTCLSLLLTACAQKKEVEVTPPPPSPTEALDQLDARTPVPLLPMMANHQKQNMRDHLVAVQEIIAALAVDDFAGVEKAAGRIGFSEQMGMMCNHMGAGAPGFSPQALEFHHTADTIAAAAKEKDKAKVLTALSATLQTCTGCHAQWKQQVVDQSTWTKVTNTAAPTGMQHP